MKQIVLIEDHEIVLQGLRTSLQNLNEETVIHSFNDSKNALDFLHFNAPDLVITDLDMPKPNGIEICINIKKHHPDVKFLAFTSFEAKELMDDCLKAGFNGFLEKKKGIEKIREAVETILFESEDYFPAVHLNFLNSYRPPRVAELSEREIEIIKLICSGLSSKEIGAELFIEVNTVESHRKNIFRKVKVKNVAGMIHYAFKNGIVEI